MMNIFELVVGALIMVIISCAIYLVATEHVKNLEKEATQATLYSECLSTINTKFQCYSMIYGDK